MRSSIAHLFAAVVGVLSLSACGGTSSPAQPDTIRSKLIRQNWVVRKVVNIDANGQETPYLATTDCSRLWFVNVGTVWDFTDAGWVYGDVVASLSPCATKPEWGSFGVDGDLLERAAHKGGTLDGGFSGADDFRILKLSDTQLVLGWLGLDDKVASRVEFDAYGSRGGPTSGGDVLLCYQAAHSMVAYSCVGGSETCADDGRRSAGGYATAQDCLGAGARLVPSSYGSDVLVDPARSSSSGGGGSGGGSGSGGGQNDPSICQSDPSYQPYGDIQVDGQCQVACLYEGNPNATAEYQAACQNYTAVAQATTTGPVKSCPACP